MNGKLKSLTFSSANFDENAKEINLNVDYQGQPISKLAVNYIIYHNQEILKVCIFPHTPSDPDNALVGITSLNGPGG